MNFLKLLCTIPCQVITQTMYVFLKAQNWSSTLHKKILYIHKFNIDFVLNLTNHKATHKIGPLLLIMAVTTRTSLSPEVIHESTFLFTRLMGNVPLILSKSFNLPFTLSLWILARDIIRDFSTSSLDNCFLPLVKAGTVNMAHLMAKSADILKSVC